MKTNWMFERSIPLLFLLVTIVAYGLLLPLTGFYWDDWPFAWMARFLGPQEFIPAFAGVRPFLGPIFFVTTSLIPPVPLYWQIFALVIRFIAVLSAWFALGQIWPRHKRQTLIASLFFLVFPGYSQHWVAFTHINQEWILPSTIRSRTPPRNGSPLFFICFRLASQRGLCEIDISLRGGRSSRRSNLNLQAIMNLFQWNKASLDTLTITC